MKHKKNTKKKNVVLDIDLFFTQNNRFFTVFNNILNILNQCIDLLSLLRNCENNKKPAEQVFLGVLKKH